MLKKTNTTDMRIDRRELSDDIIEEHSNPVNSTESLWHDFKIGLTKQYVQTYSIQDCYQQEFISLAHS